MIEINIPYTLAENIILDVRATLNRYKSELAVDELEISINGKPTDISRLSVYKFATLEPISVEDDIINTIKSLADD